MEIINNSDEELLVEMIKSTSARCAFVTYSKEKIVHSQIIDKNGTQKALFIMSGQMRMVLILQDADCLVIIGYINLDIRMKICNCLNNCHRVMHICYIYADCGGIRIV